MLLRCRQLLIFSKDFFPILYLKLAALAKVNCYLLKFEGGEVEWGGLDEIYKYVLFVKSWMECTNNREYNGLENVSDE